MIVPIFFIVYALVAATIIVLELQDRRPWREGFMFAVLWLPLFVFAVFGILVDWARAGDE